MKALKAIFIVLLRTVYCAVVIALLFLLIVIRPNILSNTIKNRINGQLPYGTGVSELAYSKLSFSLRSVAMEDLTLTFSGQEDDYNISAGRIVFIIPGLEKGESCQLVIENGNVNNEEIKVDGIHGRFNIDGQFDRALQAGSVTVDRAQYREYALTSIYSHMTFESETVVFDRIGARAYRGQITGEGNFQLTPEERLTATLNFKDIDTGRIPSVKSQLKGILAGLADFTGTLTAVDQLTVDFTSPSSEMEKTVLKYLMGNVGDSLAFLPFAEALENNKFIHLDNFKGSIHNVGQDTLEMKMNLDSSQLNLNLNPTVTINMR